MDRSRRITSGLSSTAFSSASFPSLASPQTVHPVRDRRINLNCLSSIGTPRSLVPFQTAPACVLCPRQEKKAKDGLASNISMLEPTPNAQGGHAPDQAQAQPIPPAVRDLERDIKREARRWRLGVRAGVGLDQELLMFGVHSQIGPIFHRGVFFRPSAEFDFGEVTDLIALNFEGVYRLPVVSRQAAWSPYVGAGPALNFIHQSFQTAQG